MADPRNLDHSKYLQALGLFVMARLHAERSNEFVRELNAFLGVGDLSHVEDAVYSGGPGGPAEFDEALDREGFKKDEPTRHPGE